MDKRLICGVGINDLNKIVKINEKPFKFYNCWKGMIERCYNPKVQEKYPTYKNCSVSEDWLYLSKFKKWFDENYIEGYQLDKDILIEGNKVYRKEACTFVPQYLNSLLTDSGAARGDMPLGITQYTDYNRKNPYLAQCSCGSGKQIRKTFSKLEEAHNWYIETKKQVVLQQIERAKSEGYNNEDVFEALLKREWK